MEFPPNPPGTSQGLSYYDAPPTRPASIQIISIFAIVLGSLITLCNGLSAVGAIFAMFFAHSGFMQTQPQVQSAPLNLANAGQAVLGIALGAVLLTGGIGGVQVRPWARRLLVKWAVADLIFQLLTCLLAFYITLTVTMPAMQQQMNRQGRGAPPAAMVSAMGPIGIVSVVIITLISCIFPCCVFYFWRKPHVIAAFETQQPSFG